jgi:V/A-type H+/Na+-transporting ATPase subunit I
MAIVKMKKAHIIALQSEKQSIINKLQKFGGLHVINIEEQIAEEKYLDLTADSDNDKVSQLEARLSQVKYSLDFISKYDKTKKPMFQNKLQVSDAEYHEYLNSNEKLEEIFNQCREIDFKFAELKNRETKLTNLAQQLEPWKLMNASFQDIKSTKNSVAVIGYVLSKFAEDFKSEFLKVGELAYYEEISSEKENTYILIVIHKDLEEEISQIQKQFGWTKAGLNDLTGTARENIDKLNSEITTVRQERDALGDKAKQLLENKQFLEILQDVLAIEKDKASIISSFGKTEKIFVLSGWVPAKLTGELEKALQEVTQSYTLSLEDPAEDEDHPVLLSNPSIVQPVEFITEQYSLPSSKGVDPNVIMSPFFIAFFGMMVSDAAYGLILTAVSAFVLFKLKPEGGLKKIMGIMFWGGISTFLWGAAFGGWFGGLIPATPWLFDPMKEPFKMMGLSLGLGVLHLYFGIGLQAYRNIRDGNILDAILDQGFWYALLTGLMMLLLPATAVIGKYLAITGAIGMVLFAGRSKKNIVMRLLSGVLSLYGVTGFLGDVLSYLRLFALGLATGVIGAVVNSMALMVGGSVIGYIFMTIFLILGHTFNLGINTLGAYVHSSRLQYVEFFGKFYEGEGKPFIPFRMRTKYIEQK